MSSQPAMRDDTARADTSRNRRATHDTVHVRLPPSPPSLVQAGAAAALLKILLAADGSPPTFSAQRDNQPDDPEP
jgi:hypothetical protein